MDKIELEIIGISANTTGNNAYALILKEVEGNRQLPIVIGAFEAQAIALEIENVKPPRPMTHDLIKNIIDKLGATVTEVYINDLNDGTFYSLIIIDSLGVEIDARPSDAIAVAVRFGSPIFIRDDILNEAATAPHIEDIDGHTEKKEFVSGGQVASNSKSKISTIDKLRNDLDMAIKSEDYEKAAEIRDLIEKNLDMS